MRLRGRPRLRRTVLAREQNNGRPLAVLKVLLQYARVAGVHMEALVDDELDLPDKLPASTDHQEIRRAYKPHRKTR